MLVTSDMELLMTRDTSLPAKLAKRLNAWRSRRNEWYSQICGYRVTNELAVRNGVLMPLCGLLTIGLAGSSLLGCAAMGLATVALAWNLFDNPKDERR